MSDQVKAGIAAAVAFCVVTAVMWFAYLAPSLAQQENATRQKATQVASSTAQSFRETATKSSSAVYAIAAALHETNGNIKDFDALGKQLANIYGSSANFQWFANGVMTNVYPMNDGVRPLIGKLDLLTMPERKPIYEKIRDGKVLALAGPLTLEEGGVGLIADLPVYLPNGNGGERFAGFAENLAMFPDLVKEAGLPALNQNYTWEMSQTGFDGKREVFASNDNLGQKVVKQATSSVKQPISETINVAGGGVYTLELAPKGGWGATIAPWQWLFVVIVSAIAAFVTFRLWMAGAKTRHALEASEKAKTELADMAMDLAMAKNDAEVALVEAEKVKADLAAQASELEKFRSERLAVSELAATDDETQR